MVSGGNYYFLITILGCQSYSYGQSSNGGNPIDTEALFKNQMVNTPATAALKQNIVYPVNYSTGLPEIKIPLYEVKMEMWFFLFISPIMLRVSN